MNVHTLLQQLAALDIKVEPSPLLGRLRVDAPQGRLTTDLAPSWRGTSPNSWPGWRSLLRISNLKLLATPHHWFLCSKLRVRCDSRPGTPLTTAFTMWFCSAKQI